MAYNVEIPHIFLKTSKAVHHLISKYIIHSQLIWRYAMMQCICLSDPIEIWLYMAK